MSVSILLITHHGIAAALLNVASTTFGTLSLNVSHLEVSNDPDPDHLIFEASNLVKKLDAGLGVLVLTDMFGSTPSNIAQELQQLNQNVRVVTGLNLPMLFRILNYPHLPLSQLAEKAVSGAKAGVFEQISEGNDDKTKITPRQKKIILVMES